MSLLAWDDNCSVNNEELDNHHKILFDLLNKLYQTCLVEDENITLGSVYKELLFYSNYHFSAEEQYMRSKGYIDTEKHAIMHNIFKSRIRSIERDVTNNNISATKELIVYLGNWLLNHVQIEDKKYSF